ncbi:MAG: extracellular solute-binding protein [Lachnospiraceae bacterium]|nr:extracellular solute-binding protein [Lachnospiraceae bacterium]
MNRKKKSLILLMLCSLLLCCCACGSTQTDEPATPTSAPHSQSADVAQRGSDSPASGHTLAEKSLVVEKYMPLKITDPETAFATRQLLMDSYGSRLYILGYYQTETGALTDAALHIFDMDTREIYTTDFRLEAPTLEEFTIASMDILNAEEISFRLNGRAQAHEDYSIFLYQTDISGKSTEPLAPFPDRTTYPWNPELGTWKIFDTPGQTSYIVSWDNDTSSTQLYSYDTDTNGRTPLATLSNEYVAALCADQENTLYYVANNCIIRYNPKTRENTQLCALMDCGITTYGDCYLLINDAKELAFITINGENPGIYFLTEEALVQDVADDTIRLTRLQFYGMEYVTKKAATLSTMSDNINIKVEKENNSQNQEAFHDRIMAEIVAGKGPELLWVSEEDLHILAEKGVLMDISTLLPEEATEQLLPGVLQLGTFDDKLVAITPEVSFHTMLASDAVWSANSWTLDDMLQILESQPDLEWPILYTKNKLNHYSLFGFVFSNDWSNSPYVDLEQGISYFNGETFLRTLELCKKYGQPENTSKDYDEQAQMLKEGTSIGRICYFYDGLRDFSYTMSSHEDICHIAGYPVSEGSGNYLYSEGYLVVNANATHIEEIKEFLAYLLDYENQYTVSWSPVRRDVLRDRVRKHSYSGEYRIAMNISESLVAPLPTKPDGSTYLEEFMVFAESAVPAPYRPADIMTILYEEMLSYFESEKNAQDTAEIIHNRVQLYFDENY